MNQTIVKLSNISKSFGGVHALKDASLELKAGEVHALIGENGAGKSTLMNILGGLFAPSSGHIELEDKKINLHNPRDAQLKGISIIHQEMALANDLTVSENIFLSEIPTIINWKQLNQRARELIQYLGFDISPKALVGSLSVAHRQIIEIAKALSHRSKIVVFDEPTAVLSTRDANRLMEVIEGLKSNGVGVIYISHRLDEVFHIADRITILKDGHSVNTLNTKDTDISSVIELMVGRKLEAMFGDNIPKSIGDIALSVDGIPYLEQAKDINFQIHRGEIVGLGGLVGAGRTELMRQIFGAEPHSNISLNIKNKPISIHNPYQGVKNGIALVPESRKEHGVILDMPIKWNITMAKMSAITNIFGFIRRKVEKTEVNHLVKALQLKADSINDAVSSLSGGNQQKVVLAKWLHAGGDILIFDEPTRGVDVGAKAEIYTLIKKLAAEGKAIIVISSEHLELFGLCDRIIVMREGQLAGELKPKEYSETNILNFAMA
ncbi:MAG: sugar ABC transporter ATP-binding protein [Alphaproteobacteria bacterium]